MKAPRLIGTGGWSHRMRWLARCGEAGEIPDLGHHGCPVPHGDEATKAPGHGDVGDIRSVGRTATPRVMGRSVAKPRKRVGKMRWPFPGRLVLRLGYRASKPIRRISRWMERDLIEALHQREIVL